MVVQRVSGEERRGDFLHSPDAWARRVTRREQGEDRSKTGG